MSYRDVLDVVFGLGLVLKVVSDAIAVTFLKGETEYNGMTLSSSPTYTTGSETADSPLFGLSLLFVVGVIVRPPATLAVVRTPNILIDVVIVGNLLVATWMAGIYLADWAKNR